LHVFPNMWTIDLKDKCIQKHIYDLIYIYARAYIERETEREHDYNKSCMTQNNFSWFRWYNACVMRWSEKDDMGIVT
jgi:hypothetical protein